MTTCPRSSAETARGTFVCGDGVGVGAAIACGGGGSGFQMEPETLLELAWDSFQALAFRLFPRVFSPCPFQFFWELEMLSSSGLIFSFRLVPLASRLAI